MRTKKLKNEVKIRAMIGQLVYISFQILYQMFSSSNRFWKRIAKVIEIRKSVNLTSILPIRTHLLRLLWKMATLPNSYHGK